MTHVVGLDLSLTGSGLACQCGLTTRIGQAGVTLLPLRERIAVVAKLAKHITEWALDDANQVTLAVLELPAYSKTSAGSVERHALWWLVASTLVDDGVAVATVPATTLKVYATGKGKTTGKGPMVDALARRLPMFATEGDDNIVDAAWLCAMGADYLGLPLVELPAANRAALAKATWPEVTR